MIACGFCREVAREKDEYFTSCGKPMFADCYTDERGNVREMCVARRDNAEQDRNGSAIM